MLSTWHHVSVSLYSDPAITKPELAEKRSDRTFADRTRLTVDDDVDA